MSRDTLFSILIALVAHASCLTLHTFNDTQGDDDDTSNESTANVSCDGGLDQDDKIINTPQCATPGHPYCQRLYGEDAGTHVRFVARTKDSSFICVGGGDGPLFTRPSQGDADCAARCLSTPDCNFYMSWDDTDRTCQGLRACNLTESDNPAARVSIYQRKRDVDAASRYQHANNQSFLEPPSSKMIAWFTFSSQPGQWASFPFMVDGTRQQYGRLWRDGDLPPSTDLELWIQQSGATFGSYWAFSALRGAGLKVPLNEALTEYSGGPGATIVVSVKMSNRFYGYVSEMARIWSGPNIELYEYSSGVALNMNGIRCLYNDPALFDSEFHTIIVSVTFATGFVEVWRDDVFLGNGTYGPPIDEWEFIKTTETWMMGIRPVSGSLRPFDGSMDEFTLFNWHFGPEDREKYLGCGGECFEECPDQPPIYSWGLYSQLPRGEWDDKNETQQGCIHDAVRSTVESVSGLLRPFVWSSWSTTNPGKVIFQTTVRVPPCKYAEIKEKFASEKDVSEQMNRTIFETCGVAVGFELGNNFDFSDIPFRLPASHRPPPQSYFMKSHIHPRILFTPTEILAVRQTFKTSRGARSARHSLEMVQSKLFDPRSPYGQMYQKLRRCDLSQFNNRTTVDDLLVNQRNNTQWIAYPDIYTMFHFAAFLALIDESNETAAELGAALACHSTAMLHVYVQDARGIANEDCEPGLGLAYDYLYNAMTEEQRQPVRRLIARYTEGRSPFDSSRGPWAAGGSPAAFYSGVVIQSLSIEGEEGYNRLVYLNELKQQSALFNWGVHEPGPTHDSWHYFTLIAAEIRGDSPSGVSRAMGEHPGLGHRVPTLAALLASSRAGLQ